MRENIKRNNQTLDNRVAIETDLTKVEILLDEFELNNKIQELSKELGQEIAGYRYDLKNLVKEQFNDIVKKITPNLNPNNIIKFECYLTDSYPQYIIATIKNKTEIIEL